MKFKSKQIGNRFSECYVYLEDKKDEAIREKFKYCMEECFVLDTYISNGYESYLGYGIAENDFHNRYGLFYSIEVGYSYKEGDRYRYDITYTVDRLRVNDVEEKINQKFTYKVTSNNTRVTLNKFIEDLFRCGLIAKLIK